MGNESGINHQEAYGRFQAQEDRTNNRVNDDRDWQSGTYKQLVHKSLNLPMTPEAEEMNIDAKRSQTINGLDWKHLAVIAAASLGGFGLYKYNPTPDQPNQSPPSVSSPSNQNYRTEIELRDAITKKPIKVDWIDGDIPSAYAPKLNNPPPFVPPK